MVERVVVMGAGMAGLCTALALAPTGREVTLIERDEAPPQSGPDEAFAHWNRRGVGQLRHSHAFLARLRTIIKDHHPALLQRLADAGCREIGFADMLPDGLKAEYKPEPGDADMAVLTSRRTTLELVMRRYVEELKGVTIVSGAFVREAIIETLPGGQLRVDGLRGDVGGEEREWRGDITVDGAGRTSDIPEQIKAAGGAVIETAEDCGILYYTRHYRLLPGASEPDRTKGPGTGDLTFVKYGLFPGDNGCFSITLAVPEIEMGLRAAVIDPAIFDKICALLPGLAAWTDPATAEPMSKVFGMGDLRSRWRSYVSEDQRATLGFFAVGDSLVRTNPLYGRGCSFAAVEADILRQVLEQTADPAARARMYDGRVKAELTRYYQDMQTQDRSAARRARNALDPNYKPPLRSKLMTSFVNDGVRIAMRLDIELLRAGLRDFHMIDPPGAWIRKPANLAKIMRAWSRGKDRNADLYPPKLGPDRAEMMQILGVDPALVAA
jgi:2-polyprenyl-6-methoxyphenol hydroxylase-like FAD-dependent oxidoreductase